MLIRRFAGRPSQGWNWAPFGELERIQREMDRLSEALGKGSLREPFAGVFPLMNVSEDKENYYIRAELPGIKAGDLEISVTGETLTLAGERKIPSENEKATYHRREREAGRFSRIVTMPRQIDTSKVDARCKDGILTVILPKAESAKPKQVPVQVS